MTKHEEVLPEVERQVIRVRFIDGRDADSLNEAIDIMQGKAVFSDAELSNMLVVTNVEIEQDVVDDLDNIYESLHALMEFGTIQPGGNYTGNAGLYNQWVKDSYQKYNEYELDLDVLKEMLIINYEDKDCIKVAMRNDDTIFVIYLE